MYKYAQIDENGMVVGISFLTGPVDAPNMVLMEGKKKNEENVDLCWRFVKNKWHEPEPETLPETFPETTEGEESPESAPEASQ